MKIPKKWWMAVAVAVALVAWAAPANAQWADPAWMVSAPAATVHATAVRPPSPPRPVWVQVSAPQVPVGCSVEVTAKLPVQLPQSGTAVVFTRQEFNVPGSPPVIAFATALSLNGVASVTYRSAVPTTLIFTVTIPNTAVSLAYWSTFVTWANPAGCGTDPPRPGPVCNPYSEACAGFPGSPYPPVARPPVPPIPTPPPAATAPVVTVPVPEPEPAVSVASVALAPIGCQEGSSAGTTIQICADRLSAPVNTPVVFTLTVTRLGLPVADGTEVTWHGGQRGGPGPQLVDGPELCFTVGGVCRVTVRHRDAGTVDYYGGVGPYTARVMTVPVKVTWT